MLTYPAFNPVALAFGPLKIYWYGIMYLVSFVLIYYLAIRETKGGKGPFSVFIVEESFFYAILGGVLGGRVGYLCFYNFSSWVADPWLFLKIWQGGMSFHGGVLGTVVALWCCSRRLQISFLKLLDFWAPWVPIGLALGRLGNFINGELWGTVTNRSWGMVYSHVDNFARHPSQLYELMTEGLGLYMLMSLVKRTRVAKKSGGLSGNFLIGYSIFRIGCECFREPDRNIGYFYGYFTLGQILTIPLLIVGIYLVLRGGFDE